AGQFSEAVQVLEEAAQTYEAEGKGLQQAQTLSLVSLAKQRLGQWQAAERTIALSLSLLEKVPRDGEYASVRAQILNSKGHLELAIGKAESALKTWQDAEALYMQAGDRLGIMGSQINQATAWETLGFYRRSCNTVLQAITIETVKCEQLTTDNLNQVLETLQTQPGSLQVIGWRSLGNALRLLGKLDESQTLLKQSLAGAQQLNSPQDESKALLSLGNTQQAFAARAKDLKKEAVAQAYTQAALDYYRHATLADNSSRLTQIRAQLNELSLLIETEQWLQAQQLLPEIETEISHLPPSRASVYAQVNFAQTLASFKQKQPEVPFTWQDIAMRLNSAAQDASRIQDKRAESYALGTLSQLQYEHQLSLSSEPQTLLQQALFLAQTENASEIAYRWQWQLGRIYKARGETEQAIAAYKAAFDTLQILRSDLIALNQEIQFSFREQVEPVYREFAELLLHPSQTPGGKPSQQNLKQAREVIEGLQLAELDNYFQDACAKPKEDIERFDPQAAVIYTMTLPQSLDAILSLPDGTLRLHTNFVAQIEVEKALERIQQYLKEPDRLKDVQEISQQFYAWLIKPFEDDLEMAVSFQESQLKTLVFILDGSLQNIPMAALYDGKQYLVQRYATALTPGLRLLGPERLSRQINALIAGVSEERQIGDREFTPLKNVEDELKAIQSVVPNQALLNASLTKTNLQERLNANPFSVVHIATHGQ
ncbi:MAG: CHAT domain-containing protein, partial [Microcystaceae cyanobacterium]